MVPKTLLVTTLLLLFLGFSPVLFSVAIPTTRSLWLNKEYHSSLAQNKVLLKQSSLDLRMNGEKERLMEGRMDLETTLDYPGTGANKNHDPKTPGTS